MNCKLAILALASLLIIAIATVESRAFDDYDDDYSYDYYSDRSPPDYDDDDDDDYDYDTNYDYESDTWRPRQYEVPTGNIIQRVWCPPPTTVPAVVYSWYDLRAWFYATPKDCYYTTPIRLIG